MATDQENFDAWFGRPLERLCLDKKEFGFIILMTTLPLLERYVRRKEKIESRALGPPFYDRFAMIFPELETPQLAMPFWNACRNGLLHRATFRSEWDKKPVYAMIIRENMPAPIGISSKNPLTFICEPGLFCSRVLETIHNDFGVYSLASELPTTMTVQDSIEATLGMDAKLVLSSSDMLNIRSKLK